MGYSFDTFVAAMKCFNCERISPADESTNMQTYLRDDPQLENLAVGSYVGDSFNEMEDKRYLKTEKTQDKNKILLDTWICPYCGHANWAYIIIKDGFISTIESIKITRDVLNQANYISKNITGEAMYISNQSIETVLENGILKTLESYLK